MQNKILYSLRRISGLSEAHTVISILTIHANGFAKYYHWLKEGIYCYCCQRYQFASIKKTVLYDHFNRGGIVKTFERQFIYLKLN